MADTPAPAITPIAARGYAHPEVLVSTGWVAEHLDDPGVRVMESDEDLLLYDVGHIPGAVKLDWVTELNDPLIRDYVSRERLQALLREKGVNHDTTIVLYGDQNNWWATYAFWVLRLFGLERLRIMDGGRARWTEEGRPLTTEGAAPPARHHHRRRARRPRTPRAPRRRAPPRAEPRRAGGRPEPAGIPRRAAAYARVSE
jgi:Rhodanese-related sulfurtransferase